MPARIPDDGGENGEAHEAAGAESPNMLVQGQARRASVAGAKTGSR